MTQSKHAKQIAAISTTN